MTTPLQTVKAQARRLLGTKSYTSDAINDLVLHNPQKFSLPQLLSLTEIEDKEFRQNYINYLCQDEVLQHKLLNGLAQDQEEVNTTVWLVLSEYYNNLSQKKSATELLAILHKLTLKNLYNTDVFRKLLSQAVLNSGSAKPETLTQALLQQDAACVKTILMAIESYPEATQLKSGLTTAISQGKLATAGVQEYLSATTSPIRLLEQLLLAIVGEKIYTKLRGTKPLDRDFVHAVREALVNQSCNIVSTPAKVVAATLKQSQRSNVINVDDPNYQRLAFDRPLPSIVDSNTNNKAIMQPRFTTPLTKTLAPSQLITPSTPDDLSVTCIPKVANNRTPNTPTFNVTPETPAAILQADISSTTTEQQPQIMMAWTTTEPNGDVINNVAPITSARQLRQASAVVQEALAIEESRDNKPKQDARKRLFFDTPPASPLKNTTPPRTPGTPSFITPVKAETVVTSSTPMTPKSL